MKYAEGMWFPRPIGEALLAIAVESRHDGNEQRLDWWLAQLDALYRDAPQGTDTVRADTLLCSSCERWKPDDQFHLKSENRARRGRANACVVCKRERDRKARAARRLEAAVERVDQQAKAKPLTSADTAAALKRITAAMRREQNSQDARDRIAKRAASPQPRVPRRPEVEARRLRRAMLAALPKPDPPSIFTPWRSVTKPEAATPGPLSRGAGMVERVPCDCSPTHTCKRHDWGVE